MTDGKQAPRPREQVIREARMSLRIYSGTGMLHHYPEELIRDLLALIEDAPDPAPQRQES